MTTMLMKYKVEIPPLTKACINFSDFIQNNALWLVLGMLIPVVLLFQFYKTPKGKVFFHKFVLSLPVVGSLFHKSSIEIFSRVFHALYSGSGENINVIKTAAEACRNSYIEQQIKTIVIPLMLREGKSFTDCLEKTGVFPANAINRFRSGEESGTLRESALQLANYYEKETTHKLARIVDYVSLSTSIAVTILILVLTVISSEIGFISPSPSDMMKR